MPPVVLPPGSAIRPAILIAAGTYGDGGFNLRLARHVATRRRGGFGFIGADGRRFLSSLDLLEIRTIPPSPYRGRADPGYKNGNRQRSRDFHDLPLRRGKTAIHDGEPDRLKTVALDSTGRFERLQISPPLYGFGFRKLHVRRAETQRIEIGTAWILRRAVMSWSYRVSRTTTPDTTGHTEARMSEA